MKDWKQAYCDQYKRVNGRRCEIASSKNGWHRVYSEGVDMSGPLRKWQILLRTEHLSRRKEAGDED